MLVQNKRNKMPVIIDDLRTLFLYVSNSVICIPREYQINVFKTMAFKLHEWNDIPISDLRTVLYEFDVEFNDTCSDCGKEMIDAPDDQQVCPETCHDS